MKANFDKVWSYLWLRVSTTIAVYTQCSAVTLQRSRTPSDINQIQFLGFSLHQRNVFPCFCIN